MNQLRVRTLRVGGNASHIKCFKQNESAGPRQEVTSVLDEFGFAKREGDAA